MAASDHLSGAQFPSMPIEDVLKLPSVDALAFAHRAAGRQTVGDMLDYKREDFGLEHWRYDGQRQRMAESGQETPVHIFTAGRKAYGFNVPEHLRGQTMFGNGHHRVAMMQDAGATHVMYTPDKQKSATDEDA